MCPDNKDIPTLPGLSSAKDAPGIPSAAPDAGLSAALRQALGSGGGPAHLPERFLKTGQDIAKRAKAEKPSFRTAAPRKGHIGPRSGHK